MISFRSSLLRLRKPSDVCDGLLAHLNIHLENDVPLADLVPQDPFGERPFLFDRDLEAMLAELDFDNEDAYREVMRQPPLEGRKKPRLAYSRNFYAGLEDMRRYYDDRKDQYYFVKEEKHEQKEAQQRLDRDRRDEMNGDEKMSDGDTEPKPILPVSSSTPTNPDSISGHGRKSFDLPPSLHPTDGIEYWKQVYKGLRVGNAAALPPSTRTSTVRNLLKMVTHKFNCHDYDSNSKERLKIADLMVPQGIGPWLIGMYSFAIVKVPADMKMARGRYVEGPVASVSVRHEAVFKKKRKKKKSKHIAEQPGEEKKDLEQGSAEAGDTPEPQGSAFDFSREVASMLFLAMQRDRDGKGTRDEVHEKESEEWWWTKNERWGGGPTKWGQLACELYEDEDPSWSAEERELQFKKREKAEEEMKRFAGVDASGKGMGVEDLIAVADQKEQRNEEGRSERGPPKKRNKMEIPNRARRAPGAGGKDDNKDDSEANGTARGGSGKKRKDSEGEHHEGRRVMYVAPSRKKFYKEWETIRPNASTWDEKMIPRRVGRPESSEIKQSEADGEWDEVFQVTSVNHHVAIMKMRISKRYLHWLETGEADQREEGGEDDILRIWRSEWFDMFDKEARRAWMVGMWRIMCWVCREGVPRQEWEKWDTLKAKEEGGKAQVDG